MLSPCVLPLLPIVATAAVQQHRWGLPFLALGLATAFALSGTLIAGLGRRLPFEPEALRMVAAWSLVGVGLLLVSQRLQQRFGRAAGWIGAIGIAMSERIQVDGIGGQFVVGALFGLVWTPCIGPTLGSAILLATQGASWSESFVLMAAFSLGAILPLIAVGALGRKFMARRSVAILQTGNAGRLSLGVITMLVGISLVIGADKWIEKELLPFLPDWLGELSTSV